MVILAEVNKMNTIQRITKNTSVLLIAKVTTFLLGFFYTMYLARYLGAAYFGIWSFSLAFIGLFSVLSDFGLFQLTIREIAQNKSLTSKYLANISVMKIILTTFTFGLIVLTINLLGYPKQTIQVVYFFALSVVFSSFTQMFYSIFQAYEEMEYQSLGQILKGVFLFFGVLIAISRGFSVIGFAALYFFVTALILLYCIIVFYIRFSDLTLAWLKRKAEVDWDFWKSTIREALPFGLSMVFVSIFYWIDSVMLSLMKGNAVVGWYNAAYRIVLIWLFIPQSLMAAFYPIMSKFYMTSRKSLKISLEKSFKYLTIFGIPIGIGTTLLAKRFILLIFGVEYMNSILPLQILIWSSVFIFLDQPFGNLLNSINKQVIITKVAAICIGVNVVSNLILIPKYSQTGASIATVLTQFIGSLLIFIWSSKVGYSVFKKDFASIMIRVLISSAFMGLFITYFYKFPLFVLVPLAVLVYFTALCIIRCLTREDIILIRIAFERKPEGEK